MQRVLQGFSMIYLDHASSSRTESKFVEAAQSMLPHFYANPSAVHILGYSIHKQMEASKKKTAIAMGFESEEVFFTASGSEAVNMGIKGIAFASQHKGKHIITFASEHHCVLKSMKQLQNHFGF
jgi:cysteine desulfurase